MFTEVERRVYRARRYIVVASSHSNQHRSKLASSIPLPVGYFEADLKHVILLWGVLNFTCTVCRDSVGGRRTFHKVTLGLCGTFPLQVPLFPLFSDDPKT